MEIKDDGSRRRRVLRPISNKGMYKNYTQNYLSGSSINVNNHHRNLQTMYQKETSMEFDVRYKPEHIEWENIKFIER
jgi:hypothetical protein